MILDRHSEIGTASFTGTLENNDQKFERKLKLPRRPKKSLKTPIKSPRVSPRSHTSPEVTNRNPARLKKVIQKAYENNHGAFTIQWKFNNPVSYSNKN